MRVSVLYRQIEPQAKVRRAGWVQHRWQTVRFYAPQPSCTFCRVVLHQAAAAAAAAVVAHAAAVQLLAASSEPHPPLACPCCPAQVVVSLKRMEDDPLKETLDNVLPLNGVRCAALCMLCMLQAALMWAAGMGCGLLWAAAQRVGLRDPAACAPPCASLSPSGWLCPPTPCRLATSSLRRCRHQCRRAWTRSWRWGPLAGNRRWQHSAGGGMGCTWHTTAFRPWPRQATLSAVG